MLGLGFVGVPGGGFDLVAMILRLGRQVTQEVIGPLDRVAHRLAGESGHRRIFDGLSLGESAELVVLVDTGVDEVINLLIRELATLPKVHRVRDKLPGRVAREYVTGPVAVNFLRHLSLKIVFLLELTIDGRVRVAGSIREECLTGKRVIAGLPEKPVVLESATHEGRTIAVGDCGDSHRGRSFGRSSTISEAAGRQRKTIRTPRH